MKLIKETMQQAASVAVDAVCLSHTSCVGCRSALLLHPGLQSCTLAALGFFIRRLCFCFYFRRSDEAFQRMIKD